MHLDDSSPREAEPDGGSARAVTHIVLFKWKPETSTDRVEAITAALTAMAADLPQIQTYRCGPDLAIRAGSWDFAVVAEVSSAADLDAYLTHPRHVEIVETLVGPVLDQRVAVQIATAGVGPGAAARTTGDHRGH